MTNQQKADKMNAIAKKLSDAVDSQRECAEELRKFGLRVAQDGVLHGADLVEFEAKMLRKAADALLKADGQ